MTELFNLELSVRLDFRIVLVLDLHESEDE